MKNGAEKNQLWRMVPYLKPYIPAITIVILLAFPMAGIKRILVKSAEYLTDEILVKRDGDALLLLPVLLISLLTVNFVVRFFHFYIIRATATRVVQKLRNDLYQHLLKLSLSYYSKEAGGSLVSRVINDTNQMIIGVSSINQFVREPLFFIGLLVYMFLLNWKLAALAILVAPLVAILLSNTGRHAKRYTHRIQEKTADLSAVLAETFTGMRVIKGFNLESFMKGQFMVRNRELARGLLKAVRVEELVRPGMEWITGLAIAGVIFVGGKEVVSGSMTPGQLMAFFTALIMVVNTVRTFGDMDIKFNQCTAAASRVFSMMDETPDIIDANDAKEMPRFSDSIEFRNLTFQYEETDRPILKNFSLKIKKGEMVALVGPSGAGKSTILGLLSRFYDAQSGSVLIDGSDIRDYKLRSMRDQIGLVTQEVFLFHDSLRANIRAGNFQPSEEAILDAAKAAQAWKFIERMPKGLNTIVGDRGQKLSGGERQRISIARAILRDSPILLLDEATSALDAENERLVQSALDNLLKGRTSIVVAHRLSTIRKADRIVVIDNGEIVEVGNHSELLARDGAYAHALSLQESF